MVKMQHNLKSQEKRAKGGGKTLKKSMVIKVPLEMKRERQFCNFAQNCQIQLKGLLIRVTILPQSSPLVTPTPLGPSECTSVRIIESQNYKKHS